LSTFSTSLVSATMMFDLTGCFEEPDPGYSLMPLDRQYSNKEYSPLLRYLQEKRPGQFLNLGFYRMNYILITLFRILKEERQFHKNHPGFIVCDARLERALNRRWFLMNHVVQVISPQLDLRAKAHLTGEGIYNITYKVEINAIKDLLDW